MPDVELIVYTTAKNVPTIPAEGIVIGRVAPNEALTSGQLRQMWRDTFGDEAAVPEGGWFGKSYENIPTITVTTGFASDSEDSKRYRAEMRTKAYRLGGGTDAKGVDASSWSPSEPMNTAAPTGPRPVSKLRNYKRGGAVEGKDAKHHAGKRPRRKDGGKAIIKDWVNSDVKAANEERDGVKHEGGYKKGGRVKKAGGGGLGAFGGLIPLAIEALGNRTQDQAPYSPGTPGAGAAAPKKRGGRAERAVGGVLPPTDTLANSVPTSRMAFQSGPSLASRAAGLKKGGEAKRADGGRLYKGQFSNEDGGRQPRKDGGKLDTMERDALPKKDFGEPGSRKYPMPDKSHAANAKARASQQEHRGHISKSTEEKIDAKADKVLHRKSGGSAGKGKMNVNIVIAPGGQHPQAAAPPPAGPMPMPPPPPRPAMPPPGMPPPGMAGPPGMPPGMPPGGPPPMMPRKRGGLVEGGAGSGIGRLEKIKDYGKRAHETEGRT